MMFDYDLKTVLRVWNIEDKQTFRRCPGGCCNSVLISPDDRLLPFMIRRSTIPNLLTHIYLVCCEDNSIYADILPYINTGALPPDLDYATAGSIDYIYYRGDFSLLGLIECGNYYLQFEDGHNTWHSENFRVATITQTQTGLVLINSFGSYLKWNGGLVPFN